MDNEKIKEAWPGWEVVRLIGNGGFGSVYEIRREEYGVTEKAALKVITIPHSQSDIDDLCAIRLQFGASKRKTAVADILAERITAQDPEHTLKMVRRRICDRRDLFIIDLVG